MNDSQEASGTHRVAFKQLILVLTFFSLAVTEKEKHQGSVKHESVIGRNSGPPRSLKKMKRKTKSRTKKKVETKGKGKGGKRQQRKRIEKKKKKKRTRVSSVLYLGLLLV